MSLQSSFAARRILKFMSTVNAEFQVFRVLPVPSSKRKLRAKKKERRRSLYRKRLRLDTSAFKIKVKIILDLFILLLPFCMPFDLDKAINLYMSPILQLPTTKFRTIRSTLRAFKIVQVQSTKISACSFSQRQ